jgi:TldD protein
MAPGILGFFVLQTMISGAPASAADGRDDVVLQALTNQIEVAMRELRGKGDESPYYVSYRIRDAQTYNLSAAYGAIESGAESDDPMTGRHRVLDVSVRVGSPKLDSTHKVRGGMGGFNAGGGVESLPIEDDRAALEVGMWRATDRAWKSAVKQFFQVKANKAVRVAEEDQADDFSVEKAQIHIEPRSSWKLDRKAWKSRLEKLSALFKSHPFILHSTVALNGTTGSTYFVDSDGARIRQSDSSIRLMITGAVRADDGMDLPMYEDFSARSPDQLPSDAVLASRAQALIARLEALRTAPTVEPYSGPAIIMNRAAGVFFHEIFGHRVEGHRQKDEEGGRTFAKKLNQHVVPDFISVSDDPTQAKFHDTFLNGYYAFDEEGVQAQRVPLVKDGVLVGFLMGRSPIKSFAHSNGHGRAQAGLPPVARQGNLIVDSTNRVPFPKLREMLISETKKRGKPYGMMFENISGGFTFTGAGRLPQAFKVIPLVVWRVYPDGRPDELVRGVDMVGTPLQSFEKILATGDDDDVFNGFCGAESGMLPVAAVAPSLLVGEIEVERKAKGHDRPPILPPPLHAQSAWPVASSEAKGGAAQ